MAKNFTLANASELLLEKVLPEGSSINIPKSSETAEDLAIRKLWSDKEMPQNWNKRNWKKPKKKLTSRFLKLFRH